MSFTVISWTTATGDVRPEVKRVEAKAAVAAHTGLTGDDYTASPAGNGGWWVSERDSWHMLVDDCTWVVLSNGRVTRAVAPGHPWLPPTDLAEFAEE